MEQQCSFVAIGTIAANTYEMLAQIQIGIPSNKTENDTTTPRLSIESSSGNDVSMTADKVSDMVQFFAQIRAGVPLRKTRDGTIASSDASSSTNHHQMDQQLQCVVLLSIKCSRKYEPVFRCAKRIVPHIHRSHHHRSSTTIRLLRERLQTQKMGLIHFVSTMQRFPHNRTSQNRRSMVHCRAMPMAFQNQQVLICCMQSFRR